MSHIVRIETEDERNRRLLERAIVLINTYGMRAATAWSYAVREDGAERGAP